MNETLEQLRDLDSGSMLSDVLAIPDHLRDALWRIESARLAPADAAGVLICGMGGSAIGADLATAALGDRCTRPVLTIRGYELPTWVTPEWSVLCSSYSGNTEETIACYDAAAALGARRTVATTGGTLAERARADGVPVIGLPGVLQPRAAVGYMFAIAAEVAALAGAAERIHTEIDATASHLEHRREHLGEQAGEIAARIWGTIPAFYGADLTTPAARRWKCQLNENSKLPAFWAELPEADHNELVGWTGDAAAALGAIFLADSDQHPRERHRIDLTAKLAAERGGAVDIVETEGETRSERLLGAVMLGDLLSLDLAARNGVDPTRVEVIERLKDELETQ
jgi:glucose/mannose-6-phosphate isomerase